MIPVQKELLRKSYPWIALILIVSGVLIGFTLFLHLSREIPIGDLLRDRNSTKGNPFYTGFLSQMGIFFWSATVAICLFCTKTLTEEPESVRFKHFLFLSASLTLLLALDDVFMLHEKLFPRIGFSEKVVTKCYAAFLLLILVRYYRIILKTEFILLAMALFFFALSVLIDRYQHHSFFAGSTYRMLYEDGSKFAGIVSWAVYFFRAGEYAVYHHASQARQ